MDVERMLFQGKPVAPDPVEHFLTGEGPAGRFEKLAKDLKFFRSQIDQSPVDGHFVAVQVHAKRAGTIVRRRFQARLTPPQDGAHARDEFTRTLTADDEIDALS